MLPLADDRTPDRVRAERRKRRLLGAAPSIAAHLAILAVVLLARPALPVAVVEDAPISVSLVPGEKPAPAPPAEAEAPQPQPEPPKRRSAHAPHPVAPRRRPCSARGAPRRQGFQAAPLRRRTQRVGPRRRSQ